MNQEQSRILSEIEENGFAKSHVKDLFDKDTLSYFNKGIVYYFSFRRKCFYHLELNR